MCLLVPRRLLSIVYVAAKIPGLHLNDWARAHHQSEINCFYWSEWFLSFA